MTPRETIGGRSLARAPTCNHGLWPSVCTPPSLRVKPLFILRKSFDLSKNVGLESWLCLLCCLLLLANLKLQATRLQTARPQFEFADCCLVVHVSLSSLDGWCVCECGYTPLAREEKLMYCCPRLWFPLGHSPCFSSSDCSLLSLRVYNFAVGPFSKVSSETVLRKVYDPENPSLGKTVWLRF